MCPGCNQEAGAAEAMPVLSAVEMMEIWLCPQDFNFHNSNVLLETSTGGPPSWTMVMAMLLSRYPRWRGICTEGYRIFWRTWWDSDERKGFHTDANILIVPGY